MAVDETQRANAQVEQLSDTAWLIHRAEQRNQMLKVRP